MARKRNPNGAGSIWQRKDGRYEGRVYVPQPDGTSKRKTVYGATWEECDEKRQELVRRARQGIPTPTRSAKLSEWLPYWLEEHIRPERKKTTYAKYETHVRLYLTPQIGAKRLESLGVADVRRMLTTVQRQVSAATAKESHRVLRSALATACREELISRNVAHLVPAPRVQPRELKPWTLDETAVFMEAARTDPLYAAFVLAVTLGLRRGEILGLRWQDIDLDRRTLTVRTQLQRVQKELYADTTKNRRSRTIPLPLMCVAPLRWQRLRQAKQRRTAGADWANTADYVFTTRTGRPIEPRNLSRSFERIGQAADLPRIRLHDARHGCASLLFAAGVQPRVVMEILGHSQIAVTMNVYTHVSEDSRREAVGHMDRLLRRRRGRPE
ncbi:tyrosine-type recombinase/integrase [Streptomyces benahoarensis]|uniref:Tyrosine-type recombinase/integrase n=1 Tax=Streptomyces benahoarensis TaxID=2595054 RepID=A0A553YSY2_9ACTN|nr:site-specific integrase [Streptomyces benahoarensis]TSB17752.1 tyrosine-type recombinase/integrase [Streptomyces benahoarensis]TSB32310.1 tyrosine-type recombinase/integrase [Streptomyces benahoarensis]